MRPTTEAVPAESYLINTVVSTVDPTVPSVMVAGTISRIVSCPVKMSSTKIKPDAGHVVFITITSSVGVSVLTHCMIPAVEYLQNKRVVVLETPAVLFNVDPKV